MGVSVMFKKYKIIVILFFLFGCSNSPENRPDKETVLKKGPELFARYGCAVCHSLEGKEIYGPPLNGIFMKKVKVLRNGKELELVADRDYLLKSVTDPRYEKVLEYKNKEMPISNFSKEDAEIIVDYLIAIGNKNNQQ